MNLLEVIEYSPMRVKIGEILSSEIINNKYIYLSFWSLIHLISGAIVFRILGYVEKDNKKRFLGFLGILILYEIVEFWAYNNINFFISENIIDVVWDLIIGFLGGFITLFLEKKKII